MASTIIKEKNPKTLPEKLGNTKSANASSAKARLVYFDYFRGFAILFIIFSHCYNWWPVDQLWEATIVNIISGSTALFVFISGFFFHHIYYPKFRFGSFLKNKALNVFVPYLLLSILFMLIYYLIHGEVVMAEFLHKYFGPQVNDATLAMINLLTGRTLWAYWYIPFAMLIFILSPVFIQFIHCRLATKLQITTVLFIVSIFVHRPTMSINPFHSLIYFVPYYLLGIIYSINRIKANAWLSGKTLILLCVTIAFAAGMYLLGQKDNAGKAAILLWNGPDYMVLQKLSLIAFMLAFMLFLQKYEFKFLNTLANMSFALYFLHQWVLAFFREFKWLEIEHDFGGVLIIYSAVMVLTYLLAHFIRMLLKRKSRYLIGW